MDKEFTVKCIVRRTRIPIELRNHLSNSVLSPYPFCRLYDRAVIKSSTSCDKIFEPPAAKRNGEQWDSSKQNLARFARLNDRAIKQSLNREARHRERHHYKKARNNLPRFALCSAHPTKHPARCPLDNRKEGNLRRQIVTLKKLTLPLIGSSK